MVVTTVPNRKKFDGETYVFDSSFSTKIEANKEKSRLKKAGVRKVRVVLIGTHLHVVYLRSL